MSICSLGGFNVRFFRQAYILAHVRTGVASMPGRTKLRLSLCESASGGRTSCRGIVVDALHDDLLRLKPRLFAAITRNSHNNLYQMVKKRTLEARSKLQHNKFPNHQPCTSQPAKTRCATNYSPTPESQCGTSLCKENPADPSSKTPKEVHKPKEKSGKSKICKNEEVLKASDCTSKPIKLVCNDKAKGAGASGSGGAASGGGGDDDCAGGDGAGGGGDGTGGKGAGSGDGKGGAGAGGPTDDAKKKTMMLLAALAALATAGLLLWWMSRRKKKQTVGETECGPNNVASIKTPSSSADLPKHVPYLLIGGGTAAFSAFRSIKSNDPRAKVLMITNEQRKPYMRPPLSKELWYSAEKGDVSKDYRFKQWTGAERSLYFEPEEFFVDPKKLMETVNGGIAVAQGFAVKKIDPTKHIAVLGDGYEITYDECLIATGCSPKNLPVFQHAPLSVKEKVMMYRSPDDFERLKRYADENKSITIVGNGFTGSELACSLANYSKDKKVKIYQVFQESGNMSRVLPNYLSTWTTAKVESLGVCVMPLTSIKDAQRDESKLKLTFNNGKSLLTDVVVVCVGCEPNTSIATTSGLEVDMHLGGFVVNAELEARRNLFVAGDASCFYDPLLGRRRVEHHDHSVISGRLAGENMVGKKKAYTHQSMFWSDLGPEIGYEGIGLVDASLPTVGVFAISTQNEIRRTDNLTESGGEEATGVISVNKEAPEVNCDPKDADDYGRGVIFYMKDDKIVGILLWNLFNRIGLARTIINQNKQFDDLNEVAKLFEIHA